MREAAASDPAAAVTATPMPWDRHQRAAALASVAMAVPERVVTNETVAAGAGVTEQWIVHRTGRARAQARVDRASGFRISPAPPAAARSTRPASAPRTSTSCSWPRLSPDDLLPNALRSWPRSSARPAPGAMDIGAACTGFLSALAARHRPGRGRPRDNVLVIGAEVLSRFVDRRDRGTSALFADGAGAAR